MTGVLKRRGEVNQRHGEDVQVKQRQKLQWSSYKPKNTKDCRELSKLGRGKGD